MAKCAVRKMCLMGVVFSLAASAALHAAVKVEFVGNHSFDDAKLRAPVAAEIREITAQGLTPARGDDTAYYIGSFYRKAGYSQVTVDYQIVGSTLRLKINEGPRTLIHKILFTGNTHIADAELDQYMIGATTEQLAKDPAQFPYTTAEVEAGADRVRGLYLSEGYLNVAVDAKKVQLSANGTQADVTVAIAEGTRFTYSLDAIHFEGSLIFSREELLQALASSLIQEQTVPTVHETHSQKKMVNPNELDRSFSPGIVNTMQRNLQSFYKSHGYYEAVVNSQADPAKAVGGKVPITFTVKAKRLFRFGGVTVKDETEKPRLDRDFLSKRFAPLQGTIYDPAKLDETYREMLRTGLFDNLRVTPIPIEGGRIRLDLTEAEAKAKELGFTGGYGSYDGAILGVSAADRDLFGHGRPLTFSVEASQRGLRGELLYVDPWFLESKYATRYRIFSVSRDEEGYAHNDVGARVDLTRKVIPHLELGGFVEAEKTLVTNPSKGTSIEPEFLGPTSYTVLSVGLTQASDFRNDPINPARGFIITSSFDYGTVTGDTSFLRAAGRFSYYLPVGKCLLAFGARGGYIDVLNGDLPIELRYFNGGGTTVRSFAERKLGPTDNHGNPLGGEMFSVFNTELTFPITGGLQGAVFVDAGAVKNKDIPDSGEMRYAIGIGLRYKLPIGPLRLDYGVNPDPKNGEAFGAFNFSFGFAF